jgi:hypothetical protein
MQRTGEAIMDSAEAQARATIAAALIVRGAVEIPSVPAGHHGMPDAAGVRLRELTEYLYRLITTSEPREPM